MSRVENYPSTVMALQLYFPAGSHANPTRIWYHLSVPGLAQQLLASAKRAHLQSALLYHVASGHLKRERVTHHQIDGSHILHSQCLELIDTEMQLRAFICHAQRVRHGKHCQSLPKNPRQADMAQFRRKQKQEKRDVVLEETKS